MLPGIPPKAFMRTFTSQTEVPYTTGIIDIFICYILEFLLQYPSNLGVGLMSNIWGGATYINSFFLVISRIWKSVSSFSLPVNYDLQKWKCNVKRHHLSPWKIFFSPLYLLLSVESWIIMAFIDLLLLKWVKEKNSRFQIRYYNLSFIRQKYPNEISWFL